MRKFTFLKQWLLVVFMLLGSVLSALADDDLITTQFPIHVEKAGTLKSLFGSSVKITKLTNIKFSGELNLDDIEYIRDLINSSGHLQHLDLEEVTLKNSGGSYLDGTGCEDGNIIENLFSHLENLKSIVLPDNITSIGAVAFFWCTNLTSVTLPPKLVNIDEYAFGCCRSLSAINLPVNLTTIGERAFEGCSSLASLTLPEGITNIGKQTFYDCN